MDPIFPPPPCTMLEPTPSEKVLWQIMELKRLDRETQMRTHQEQAAAREARRAAMCGSFYWARRR